MVTSAVLYHVMNFFHITIDIRNVCVFLAPLFSSFTTLVTYHLTKELKVGCPRFYNYLVITKHFTAETESFCDKNRCDRKFPQNASVPISAPLVIVPEDWHANKVDDWLID